MNSRNSKTSDPQRLLLKLTDKINLKRSDKYIALSQLSTYYIWKHTKKPYKNNTFKISAPTLTEEFELPDASYSVSDIQNYFKYIIQKRRNETVSDSSLIRTYISKIESRITFGIKTGYYLKLLTPDTMKSLGITNSKIG